MPALDNIAAGTRELLDVRRVFGDPVEKDGVTIIPVARLRGGGGGGQGPAETSDDASAGEAAAEVAVPEAGGAGFGIDARPVGIYVIRPDRVDWKPAVDVSRLAMGGMVLAGIMTVVAAGVAKRFAHR